MMKGHQGTVILLVTCLVLALSEMADASIPLPSTSAIDGARDIRHRAHFQIARGGASTVVKKKTSTVSTPTQTAEGTATIPNEIVNLVKSVVGAGVLGLPAGIAAFSNSPRSIVPVALIVLLVGAMSGYCFSLIGRVCAYTDSSSYREAWSRSVSSQRDTSWMPAVGCLLVTSCSVLAYSMILADTLPALIKAYLGMTVSRTNALLGVTIFTILPLCLLKDMSSLAVFSFLGTAGMIYTAIAMSIRYFDGSYALPDGKFLQDIQTQPVFGDSASIWSPKVFLLLSMLTSALMCHYNAPRFYTELKDASVKRYNTVVAPSFAVAIVVFIAFAGMGFLTFGSNSMGLVLNNYATQDSLMSASRLAVAASIVFGYPLAFVGVRDGVLDMCKVKNRSDSVLNTLTVGLLTLVTILAFYVQNLRSVLSLGGATWGNLIVYAFPTFMFCRLADTSMPSLKKEKPVAILTGLTGLCMGVIGTVQAIKSMKS